MIKNRMKKLGAFAVAAIMAASIAPTLAAPCFAAEEDVEAGAVSEEQEMPPAEMEESVTEDSIITGEPEMEQEEAEVIELDPCAGEGNSEQITAFAATNITLGSSYSGTMAANGSKEFSFTTSGRDSYYEIRVTNSSIPTFIEAYLYNSNKQMIDFNYYIHTNQAGTFRYMIDGKKLEKNKRYYISVKSYAGTSGKYTVQVTEKKDDYGNTFDKARSIGPGTYSGAIEVTYDADWMKFVVPSSGTYKVSLISQSCGYGLEYQIHDKYAASMGYNYYGSAYGQNSSTSRDYAFSKGQVVYISVQGYEPGRYVFSIEKVKNTNPMSVSTKSKKVKKSKVRKSAQKVTAISVSGAQGAVTFKKAGGSGKLSVDKNTGKITVKKKTKKGKYTIKVAVSAAGTGEYYSKTTTVRVTVRIK